MQKRATNFDLCICDGEVIGDAEGKRHLRVELNTQLHVPTNEHWQENSKKISNLIYVTSLPFRISLGNEMRGKMTIVETMSFDSWREDDYEKAALSKLVEVQPVKSIMQNDWRWLTARFKIVDAEKKLTKKGKSLDRARNLEVVRRKYFYAGGCVRYMFDMDMEDLQKGLDEGFDAVSEPTAFTEIHITSRTTESVNPLMQRFSVKQGRPMCTPVSKYVLQLAYEKCRSQLTDAVDAVAKATDNPMFRGWAFELRQLDVIRSELGANPINNNEASSAVQLPS